jgi:hypothetical protein
MFHLYLSVLSILTGASLGKFSVSAFLHGNFYWRNTTHLRPIWRRAKWLQLLATVCGRAEASETKCTCFTS